MGFKNKKASAFMLKKLVNIVFFALIFISMLTLGCGIYKIVLPTPQDKMLEYQLEAFTDQINSLTYSTQEYMAMPLFITMSSDYNLVGFDSTGYVDIEYYDVLTKNPLNFNLKRPSKCKDSSCFCIYYTGAADKYKDAKLKFCSNVDADYIFASSEYAFLKKFRGSKVDWKSDFIDEFEGAKQNPHALKDYNKLLSQISDSYSSANTANIGFEQWTGTSVYYFLLSPSFSDQNSLLKDALSIDIFAELIQKDDIKVLTLFPYYHAFNNRKYYIIKEDGIEKCKNNYLHKAIPISGSQNFTYCKMSSQGLVESKDQIQKCPKGEIKEMCVCGERAVYTGYCVEDYIPPKGNNPPKDILLNPYYEIFCSENQLNSKCSDYINPYMCVNDICNQAQSCTWKADSKNKYGGKCI